jgi:hypothetical protein
VSRILSIRKSIVEFKTKMEKVEDSKRRKIRAHLVQLQGRNKTNAQFSVWKGCPRGMNVKERHSVVQ